MQPKAVLFDYMGTCLDWHSGLVAIFPSGISAARKSEIALQWRQQYFVEVRARFDSRLPVEEVLETFRRALDITLQRYPEERSLFTADLKHKLVQQWHSMKAWPDVPDALEKLREEVNCELFVHANGSTRLQLDLTRSAGLRWDMLFSSQLLGYYKPAPEAYLKALELIKLRPEDCILVAAHAYDLRGAKAVGMKTIYIERWTDDIDEDRAVVKGENDAYLSDMSRLSETISRL
jgi:2-haloalkanoic acid dehalogenase type II